MCSPKQAYRAKRGRQSGERVLPAPCALFGRGARAAHLHLQLSRCEHSERAPASAQQPRRRSRAPRPGRSDSAGRSQCGVKDALLCAAPRDQIEAGCTIVAWIRAMASNGADTRDAAKKIAHSGAYGRSELRRLSSERTLSLERFHPMVTLRALSGGICWLSGRAPGETSAVLRELMPLLIGGPYARSAVALRHNGVASPSAHGSIAPTR